MVKGCHNVVGGHAAHGHHLRHVFCHGDVAVLGPHVHLRQGTAVRFGALGCCGAGGWGLRAFESGRGRGFCLVNLGGIF